MRKFAKLFESEDIGQVLVMAERDHEDDFVCSITATSEHGRVTVAVGFDTMDRALDHMDRTTEGAAVTIARALLADAPFTPKTQH